MKMFAGMVSLALTVAACGNPIFHRSSGRGDAGPPDPEEYVSTNVVAGNWTVSVFVKRKDGPVKAMPEATTLTGATAAFSFTPVATLPFSKTESLPLGVTLEEASCATVFDAAEKNGAVEKKDGDAYSTSSSGSEAGQYGFLETVAVKRGDACALLSFRNETPGKATLGPLSGITALTIFMEAKSVQHHG